MARVASCPQCEHELLVPDDAEPSALVKCPECRAFFELQHASRASCRRRSSFNPIRNRVARVLN